MKTENYKISNLYIDFPSGRPQAYSFTINGKGAANLTSSTNLLTGISQNIISNCQSVSLVRFWRHNTYEEPTFGMMSDGKIKEFRECGNGGGVRIGMPDKIYWGSVICE